MATRESILVEKTFKGQTDELDKRVFYTLTEDERLQSHRVAKTLGLLVKHLHAEGLITDEQIDEILFLVIQ